MSWLSDFEKRIKLTIDNTNIDATLTDFPVLVKLSNSSGITLTDVTSVFTELGSDANRKKIAVTTSDGTTQCYVEIERWDHSNNEAWLWVKVPTVVSGTTTDLYLYYDSTQSDNTSYIGDTTETPAQNVWDSNFKLVMHMAQDPNGDVANAIKDSTINANHGTPSGSMTSADLVDGKVGKGIDFDGINDYITVPDLFAVNPSEITFEIILKADGAITEYRPLSYNEDGFYFSLRINQGGTANKIYVFVYDGAADFIETTLYSVTSYRYIAVSSKEGGNTKLSIDKDYIGQDGGVGSFSEVATTGRVIGAGRDGGDSWFDGISDEVRISNISRSVAWKKATYYSNWDELISFEFEEEEIYYISGYVKEGIIPVNRQIYLHNRNTGALIGSTTSSGAGSYFYMETTYSGAHYVVCLDDETGVSYNDLIYGNIFPATISG